MGTKPMNRPTVKEPIKNKEVRDTIYDNIQLPGVMMGYHTPAQGTPDSYAVSMLAQILSQGKSSRLQKSIVDEQQKAIFVGAFPFPTEDPGMALMFGITNMGVAIDELEASINKEVEKVQTELISEEEFQKLKNQIESDMVTANSKVEGIAENLANYFVYYGDANLINTEVDRYLKVTREDIKRVANEYFRKDNRVVLHYLPKSQKPN
jgi:zinc protease